MINTIVFILIKGGDMRLTRAGEYAVRCVLFLAANHTGKIINRKLIAGEMDIPDQFLSKIATQLARAGILEIIQGARGGLRLIRQPDKVTLLEVVEAVIGEIYLNDCIMEHGSCKRKPVCSVHLVWDKARTQLRETLREVSFADLIQRNNCLISNIKGKEKSRRQA
jgi:Rrf2 family transcriptional regulator, iron-sulfur cluster assembly transcription factor